MYTVLVVGLYSSSLSLMFNVSSFVLLKKFKVFDEVCKFWAIVEKNDEDDTDVGKLDNDAEEGGGGTEASEDDDENVDNEPKEPTLGKRSLIADLETFMT